MKSDAIVLKARPLAKRIKETPIYFTLLLDQSRETEVFYKKLRMTDQNSSKPPRV